jgi:outer membrane biosynthesis protein TonB
VLDEKAGKERKERTHKLIQLGLLFGYSELDESPRDFLAGLLLLGANMPEQERQKLSELGADLLAKKEPKKGKKTPASPPAAPAQTPQSAPTQRPAPAAAPAKAPAPAPAPAPAAAPAPAKAPAPAAAPAKAPAAADVVLDVNFSDKDAVKALGARFNYDSKKWFVPAGMDTQPFKKWMV